MSNDPAMSLIPAGASFTVLENTASSKIKVTFGNLPDGATVVIGLNRFVVSYEGGDGNDLTLTAVP